MRNSDIRRQQQSLQFGLQTLFVLISLTSILCAMSAYFQSSDVFLFFVILGALFMFTVVTIGVYIGIVFVLFLALYFVVLCTTGVTNALAEGASWLAQKKARFD